jgi:PPM family protein phosphatase
VRARSQLYGTDALRRTVLIEQIAGWLSRASKATAVADIPELAMSFGTTIGVVRTENQDRAIVVRYSAEPNESFLCMALCDGMGGMADGGRCAEIALGAFVHSLVATSGSSPTERVCLAVQAANLEIHRRYREKGGTTIAALLFTTGSAVGVTVGDTRIYAVRPGAAAIQISVDDTVSDELKKVTGRADVGDDVDPFAGQLTQFLGIGEPMRPRTYGLHRDGGYLLASDGVHSIAPATLQQLFFSSVDPHEIVLRLLSVSRWCGGRDNGTALFVSAIPEHWNVSPQWATASRWIEIWDPGGKLEIAINPELLKRSAVAQDRGIAKSPSLRGEQSPFVCANPPALDAKPAAIIERRNERIGEQERHNDEPTTRKKKSPRRRKQRVRIPADRQAALQIEIIDGGQPLSTDVTGATSPAKDEPGAQNAVSADQGNPRENHASLQRGPDENATSTASDSSSGQSTTDFRTEPLDREGSARTGE